MKPIFSNPAPSLQTSIRRTFPAPCALEDSTLYRSLIEELLLNPNSSVPPTSGPNCGSQFSLSALSILNGSSIDDPDRGMDQELPYPSDLYDPKNDRKWMGGFTGPTSQGFRHMYFGGWKWNYPLTTLQIPPRAVGQAPLRVAAIAQKAKEFLKSGQLAWGFRLSTWAMHYIQDLAQPFHSVQILNFKMVPWYELFTWPPQKGVDQLIKESTRIVANFHWAYEEYVEYQISIGEDSPFKNCLSQPENFSALKLDARTQSPEDIALAISLASIKLAPRLGSTLFEFFGHQLTEPQVNLALNPHSINYSDYEVRPDLVESRKKLHEVTCECLANAAIGSQKLLEWTLQP